MSEEKAEVVEEKKLAVINTNGLLDFTNQEELKLAANVAMATDLALKQIKDKGLPAVCAALLACKQYGLPQKAMGQMGYIHGKITFYGSLVTALAEQHPDYGEKIVKFVDHDQEEICMRNKNLNKEVYACVILGKKKGDDNFSEFFFTIDDAKKAGLYPAKEHSAWAKYTKDMIYHKANKRHNDALYASAVEGINYHEDLVGVFEERDVTPAEDKLGKILEARKNENIENQG